MKTQILLLAALLAPSPARALTENPPPGMPRMNECYPRGYVFLHHVVAKIGKNRYEMASEINALGHGVLKTKRPLAGPGLVNVPMKLVGRQDVELLNGFTAKVWAWEECTLEKR